MSAEFVRIMQRCSKQQFAVPKDYRKRLGQSGYRHSTSEGKGEMARYPTESGEKPATFVHMFKELNSNAKRCGMPTKFASRGGRILHYKFAPPAERHKAPPPPCNPDQQDDPIWHLQGTVHEHECIEQGCPKGSGRYIGQSGNASHRKNKDHASIVCRALRRVPHGKWQTQAFTHQNARFDIWQNERQAYHFRGPQNCTTEPKRQPEGRTCSSNDTIHWPERRTRWTPKVE